MTMAHPYPFLSQCRVTHLRLYTTRTYDCLEAFSGQQRMLTSISVEQEEAPECPRNKEMLTSDIWKLEDKHF